MPETTKEPPEWIGRFSNDALPLTEFTAAHAGYTYHWNGPAQTLPEEFRHRGAWRRGKSLLAETLEKATEQFRGGVDLTALADEIAAVFSRHRADFNTFEDLRVHLVPVVSCYRKQRYQTTSRPCHHADLFLLTADGKLDPASVSQQIEPLLEDPIIFGTCDNCGDAYYHDHLIRVDHELYCPTCKKDHEQADETVHGGSDGAG